MMRADEQYMPVAGKAHERRLRHHSLLRLGAKKIAVELRSLETIEFRELLLFIARVDFTTLPWPVT
jgi:hypothetical protein